MAERNQTKLYLSFLLFVSMVLNADDPHVSFLICGTQKGGTTALDAYLRRHDQLQLATTKEVHYFDTDELFSDAQPNHAWYHSHFQSDSRRAVWGESTPIYMYWKPAAERIYHYNPSMKIILLLRNPIDRAYSHWNMELRRNSENLAFYDALMSEGGRCASADGKQHRVYSYTDRGFYTKQIASLRSYFLESNIHIAKSEFLLHQPRECLNSICSFLGIAPLENTTPLRAHSLPYTQPMQAKERIFLRSVFSEEIQSLEQMLQWDCSAWLNF
jgi:hypothetical protein